MDDNIDFRLSLSILTRESGEVVCYKQDGTRFDQVHTVKLNASTEYEMRFTLQPPLHIDKLMINGDLHKLELLKSQQQNDDTRTYRTLFETAGFDVTKKKTRKELLLVFELQNGVYMKFALQCKVYKAGETDHAHWGQKLSAIHMECKIESGHNYVTVVKGKYL